MSVLIKLSRSNRVYRPHEALEGKIITKLSSSISHSSIRLTFNGSVNMQVRGGSAGVIESLVGVIKPVSIVNKSIEIRSSGRIPSGTTEIPFTILLRELGEDSLEKFYETFHGANISIQYLITVDIARGYLHKSLSATVEFIIENGTVEHLEPPVSSELVIFYITQDTQRHPLLPELKSGSGFFSWKRAMLIALSAKNKLGFVDGSVSPPDVASTDFRKWQRANDMVISWILNALSPDIADSFLISGSAKDIWSDLLARYGISNGAQLFSVEKDLAHISQGSDNFAGFFTRIKRLWDEKAALKVFPVCTLGSTCALAKAIKEHDQQQRLLQLLMGLNESFSAVRGSILMMTPLPDLSVAYSMLSMDESQRGLQTNGGLLTESSSMHVDASSSASGSAYQASSGSSSPSNSRWKNPNLVCTFCKRQGHAVDKCYKLHGFPKDNEKTGSKTAANVSSEDSSPSPSVAAPVTSAPNLTMEQYVQLLQLLQKPACSSPNGQVAFSNSAGTSYISSSFSSVSGFVTEMNWIIDSGASDHMCYDLHCFSDIKVLDKPFTVRLPTGDSVFLSHYGNVRMTSDLVLEGVLHVPQFTFNLLSISKLTSQLNCQVVFTSTVCFLQGLFLKRPLVLGDLHRGLYIALRNKAAAPVQSSSFNSALNNSSSSSVTSLHNKPSLLWHCRLGHLPYNRLKSICPFPVIKDEFDACDICAKARHHRLPFSLSTISTTSAFELIHVDTWGPYKTETYDGYKYFLTIVDDFTRLTWTHLLKTKGGAFSVLKSFIQFVTTQFGKKVRTVRSDNAFELGLSNAAAEFYVSQGILHQTSCVYTPQQNGVVERKHKHLLEVSRSLLFQSHLPLIFWGDCVLTATYLINRFPTAVLNGDSPFLKLFGVAPSFGHIRNFGCLAYASTHKPFRDKFQPRAIACIFIGYPFGKKAYKLYCLKTKQVFSSRDVIFHESIYPYQTLSSPPFSALPLPIPDTSLSFDSFPSQNFPSQLSPTSSSSPSPPTLPFPVPSTLPTPPLRRSTRNHHPPSHLNDFFCGTACSYLPPSSLIPPTHYCLSSQSVPLLLHMSEPVFYEDAVQHPEWRNAMSIELDALEANNTWSIVDLPLGKRPISSKWVYKLKFRADGSLERHKARLVIKGCTQKAGIDFTETFSPVVKMTTIRCLVATAVKKGWSCFQLDVNNAFLHGEIDTEVYMKIPLGLTGQFSGKACLLNKALYGLKQASRQWYSKLAQALVSQGYTHSLNDYSLFHKKRGSSVVYLAVYVDDILVTGNDIAGIDSLKSFLHAQFRIKDLGTLCYFLGIEFIASSGGLIMSQRKFAQDLLNDYELDLLKEVSCPLDPYEKLKADEGDFLSDPTPYRKLVGKLNFLANTRPDLSFSIQHLCQFMQQPTTQHWNAAMHTLKYLQGTVHYGLLLSATADFSLLAYCDSDWASCPCSRRSVSGYYISLGSSPVSWKSKKQITISLSSAEAEYRSLRRLTAELAWLTRLLHELDVPNVTPVPVKCDSQAAIHIAKNPVFHERTKHIDIDCHYVRAMLLDGLISLSYVPTDSQVADVFTKALPKSKHIDVLPKLGLVNQPPT